MKMTANDVEDLNQANSQANSEDIPFDSRMATPDAPSVPTETLGNLTLPPRHTNDKRINEDYKIWKKNIPFLYDLFLMTATQFPSYTVDWISDLEEIVDENSGAEYDQQKVVLGTTARSEEEITQNGIILMNVRFPKGGVAGFSQLEEKKTEFRPSVGFFTSSQNVFSVYGIIAQSFPITNVQVMPQKTELVCAKLADSTLVIYDWKRELGMEPLGEERPPMLELGGHDTRGPSSHGLAWNPTTPKAGLVASCGRDGRILVWDISGARRRSDVQPFLTLTGHKTEVQDVAWHPLHTTLLASAGLDHAFCLFDIRSHSTNVPSHRVVGHTGSVNGVSFAKSEFFLATAADDAAVFLWDLRNLSKKLHSFRHHCGDVFSVAWCHDVERATLLCSAGSDRKICIWDVSKINEKNEKTEKTEKNQKNEKTEKTEKIEKTDLSEKIESTESKTPPELVFVHGGHTGRVTDVTWNPAPGRKLMISSVSEDAIVQVWTPARYQIWPLDNRDPTLKKENTESAPSTASADEEAKVGSAEGARKSPVETAQSSTVATS